MTMSTLTMVRSFSLIFRAFIASTILMLLPSLALAAPPGWTQTWGDEFDGTQIDTAKWDPIFWNTPHNNEQQAYRPDRATVSGGNLILTADNTPNGGKQFTSGKVESTYTQQYGRWEIRAKLPGTQGTWPAIWLLPDTDIYGWPTQGEIDILENRGHQPNLVSSAYHWGQSVQGHQYTFDEETYSGASSGNYHNDFHTYAVEWSASELKFFVDDVNYHTITDARTGGFLSNQTAPMETVLNVAVGGDFLGGQQFQPNGNSVWPQQMLVDYVRIFQRDQSSLLNGSFEDQGGSLNEWTTFGNSIPNVLVENEAVLQGSNSLKIFGQFNGGQNYSGASQGITVEAGDNISASASAYIRSQDALAGGNSVAMTFDYYSVFEGVFDSADHLGSKTITIAEVATTNDQWFEHTLTDTVPENAVEARLSFVFDQPNNGGGAIHIDDVSLFVVDLVPNADADDSGEVDGQDFLAWQRGFGQTSGSSVATGDFNHDDFVDMADLAVWQQQYAVGSVGTINSVPEPSAIMLCLAFLCTCCKRSRIG